MLKLFTSLLIVIGLTTGSIAASFEDNDVERHRPIKKVTIKSSTLDESVDLYVQLPFKYHEEFASNYRYPVLYVLDAPENIGLFAGVIEPLVGYNNAPQMLVVGIATNNRNRDFTPTLDPKYEEHGGGADNYLLMIEKEVVPYIDEHYRTEEYRILSGHSYGGLLVAQSFYKKPHLFQAHFAHSPSLFWNNSQVPNALIDFIQANPTHKNFLYMNMGNEGNPESESPEGLKMLQGVQSIETVLKKISPDNLDFKFEYFDQEPHQTTQIYGALGALRGLYPKWSVPYKTSLAGFDAFTAHFDYLTKRYGYTIEPKSWQIYDEGVAQLEFLNNPEEAIRYFKYNLERDPSLFEERKFIIDALTRLGQTEDAKSHLAVLLAREDLSEEERRTFEAKQALLTDANRD